MNYIKIHKERRRISLSSYFQILQKLRYTVMYFLLIQTTVFGQTKNVDVKYPEIGKPCPKFLLKNIENYPKRTASLNDFKDQYFILNFWNKDCSSCVAEFPEINKLQNKFDNKLKIILVGFEEKGIHEIYEKFKNKLNLNLTVAFDAATYNQFVPYSAPHQVWIDNKGIVRAITTGTDVNIENIHAFIKGEKFIFSDKSYKAHLENDKLYNLKLPLLINGNGGQDTSFIFRSVLSNWNPKIGVYRIGSIDQWLKRLSSHLIQATAMDISYLYFLAYSGQSTTFFGDPIYNTFWNVPIIESQDSVKFKPNWSTGENVYCYSLSIPLSKSSVSGVMKIMQNDLDNYFNLDVAIEDRSMPCYNLVSSQEARTKLKTTGMEAYFKGNTVGFSFQNYPVSTLLGAIYAKNQLERPFFDETGITGNIDISIDCLLTNLDEVKKELKKNGLNLVNGQKIMKVIVLKEKISKK